MLLFNCPVNSSKWNDGQYRMSLEVQALPLPASLRATATTARRQREVTLIAQQLLFMSWWKPGHIYPSSMLHQDCKWWESKNDKIQVVAMLCHTLFTNECEIDFCKLVFTDWKLCCVIYVQLKKSCIIKKSTGKILKTRGWAEKKFSQSFLYLTVGYT